MSPYRASPDGPAVLVVAFGYGVRGLDPKTGKVIWEHESGRGRWAIQITSSEVYAANGGTLVCLDYLSGEVLWTENTVSGANVNLLLAGERLYVGCQGELECFNLDGEKLWHNALSGKGTGAMAIGFPGNVVQADMDS